MTELTKDKRKSIKYNVKTVMNDSLIAIKKHKAILYVFFSNSISLVIGAIISFLIPYFLDVNNYGYYREFTLYLSYVGLLHFGFNDGIYLEYGAYNYDELPRGQFRMYFRYLFFQQFITSLALFIIILFLFHDHRFFIFSFVLLNMILINIIRYFSFICQVTRRYKLYSVSYLIEKTLLIVPLSLLFIIHSHNYQYIILSQTFVNVVLAIFILIYFKSIIFGHKAKYNFQDIKDILKMGMTLMLGNFIVIMIFNVDRIIIDLFLPLSDFSVYSLAVNLLSIILVFVSTISLLLYPYLKRKDEKEYKSLYIKMSNITSILSSLGLLSYFPIKFIIETFLPDYSKAIPLFFILLPGVCLRVEIDAVLNNLFKTLKKQKVYFLNSILVLIVSIILNIILFYFLRNVYAITISSLLTFIIWYILEDIYLIKYFKLVNIKKYVMLVLAFGIYFLSSYLDNLFLGFIIFLGMITMVIILVYHRNLKLNL